MADVIAPMPGTIKEIIVKVGDAVKEDEELVILEAMKMENPIVAPSNGTVKEIKGRKVVVGATLWADGEICATGEVVAVQMPENMIPG